MARPAYVAVSVLLLSVLLVGTAKGQQFSSQRVITTSADTALSVHAADLTGNGSTDVLSGSSDVVAWYENFGVGEFGSPTVIDSTEERANTVYAADLDGDGDKDVAVLMRTSIVWYENTGGGTFSEQKMIDSDSGQGLFVKDLDGDGNQDILIADLASDEVAWYENTGGGSFSDRLVIDAGAERASAVHTADFDRDGDQDVVATALDNDNVVWYENLGDGSFSAPNTITADASGARSVFAADFDGDNDKDIVYVAGFSPHETVWHENMGGGSFAGKDAISTAPDVNTVYAADLTGDGDNDVLTASGNKFSHPSDEKISWYENTGGGAFSTENVITTETDRASSVYAADLDGDTGEDVLSASFDDDTVAWYQNQNTDETSPAPPTGLTATSGDSQVDLNWDANTESDLAGYNVYRSTSPFQEISNATQVNEGLLGEASYTDSDVSNGTEYFYRVTAVDDAGNESGLSGEASAIPEEQSPAAPTGLTATAGDGQVDLSWDPNSEEDLAGYHVYRSTSSFQEVGNATRRTDFPVETTSFIDDVSNGTEYFYRVTAVDTSDNESGPSNEASATPTDQTPPSAPTGLQATGGNEQVSLGWENNSEEDLAGYNVYRSTSSFPEVTDATQVNEGLVEVAVYADGTVTNGTEYFYRVTAVDTSGNGSEGSNEDSATPRPPPVAQTEPATDVTRFNAVLNGLVDPNGKETTVVFEYYPTGQPDNSQGVPAQESPLTGTDEQPVSAQTFELASNTEYTFKVVAGSNSGGDEGDTRTFTTTSSSGPAAPTGLTATAGDGQVGLGWDANSEEDLAGYNVYRSTSSFSDLSNATKLNGSPVSDASYTDPDVTGGTEYFYRVTAVSTSGTESGGSNQASATPFLEVTLSRSVDTPEQGAPLDVSMSVGGGATPTDVQLFYRQAGASEFQSVTLDAATETTYEGTVPGDAVTERGLEYYGQVVEGDNVVTVPAERPAAAPRQVPVQVPQRDADVNLGEREYRMVSVPLGLSSPGAVDVLRDDLGEVDRTEWRLLRWDATAEEYVEATQEGEEATAEFVPGRAYWLISRQGGTFDVEDARSVSEDSVSLTLPRGWTQLANPYPFPVRWADIEGTETVNAPVAFDPESPDSLQFGVSVLKAWTGYWVFNPNESPVQLTIPQKEALSTDQNEAVAGSASTTDSPEALFGRMPTYALQMEATFESLDQSSEGKARRDLHNVVGLSAHAQSGVGREDVAEPPPIGDHVRLSIVEDETQLAGSLRPTGKDGYAWDVEISASGEQPRTVRVELRSVGTVPSGAERRLIDQDTGRRIAIEEGGFTVSLTEEFPTRHLRLLLGSEEFTRAESQSIRPDRTGLRAVYPNPARGAVSVDYHLKAAQEVRIGVYDLLGRRVRTLVSGRRSAGPHTARWAGPAGAATVASGTYFVRMTTESTSVSRRVVIVQ